MKNIFKNFYGGSKTEIEEEIFTAKNIKLARIKSIGHTSSENFWYEQDTDEWVMVLGGFGEIEWPDGSKKMLGAGDYIFIPAFEKHRVSYTSQDPPCIWLAAYGQITKEEDR